MADDGLELGTHTETDNGAQPAGTPLVLDPDDLTTHGVIVGMTGSGKTGAGIVLIEELLRRNIPVLAIDPKGDLGNLMLTFPGLSAEEFAPWVPAGTSAEDSARTWTEGLAGSGIDAADIAALRDGHPMAVYTPGSTAGVPLNVIGDLSPTSGAGSDAEQVADEISASTQAVLGLAGISSDPLSGREHILIANLISRAWESGQPLDLGTLVGMIIDPPIRKLGVIEIDQFFPPDDRTALAMSLNGLLASPAFAAWHDGAPLDIDQLLWTDDGQAKAAIIHIAHLDDAERQLVVARLAAAAVTWMRRQPGSDRLRAAIYMDEVMGYLPPSANPPSKAPLLSILKQARAFGLGMVLSTQNPVDLDYKALSNAGTWLVGRLQTERDLARLAEGLATIDGGAEDLDALISALPPRRFLLHSTKRTGPEVLSVRWAMSYLRGPITREEIATLPGQPTAAVDTASSVPTPSAPDAAVTAASDPANASAPAAPPSTPPAVPAELADDETPTMPPAADGVAVRFVTASAPWLDAVGASPEGTRLVPALCATATVLFDDTAADLRHTDTWEAIATGLGESGELSWTVVDHDPRDFVDSPPSGAVYVLPEAPISTKKWFGTAGSALRDHLTAELTTTIAVNRELKVFGRPGEDPDEFAARCERAADDAADAEADKLRSRIEARIDKLRSAIDTAQLRADQLEEEASMTKTSELVSGAGSLLGALLGGKKNARSLATAGRRLTTGRERSNKAKNRTEAALQRVEQKTADLEELEADLAEDLEDIALKWDAAAAAVEELEVPLEKSDVTVSELCLVWLPTAR